MAEAISTSHGTWAPLLARRNCAASVCAGANVKLIGRTFLGRTDRTGEGGTPHSMTDRRGRLPPVRAAHRCVGCCAAVACNGTAASACAVAWFVGAGMCPPDAAAGSASMADAGSPLPVDIARGRSAARGSWLD